MPSPSFYDRLVLDDSLVRKTGFNPYYRRINSALTDPFIVDGREFINLASNNYLGLADDLRIKEAAIAAIEKYGTSLCGTPVATGYIDLYERTAGKLAGFLGLEDAVILPSGYQANNGLFSAIAGKNDLAVIDHYVHSSLVNGIRNAGCRILPFLHNNNGHLNEVLKKNTGGRQVFVVTESVFSTDGSIAPVADILSLCDQYNAIPVIDDSHGIGVIGSTGRGILEYAGITEYKGIYTASLGKALANAGGIIAGKRVLIEHLKYYCPHLVYSTALIPAPLAGVEKTMEIIQSEFDVISTRMWRYKKVIHEALSAAGFTTTAGSAPINSIIAGTSEQTFALTGRLYENNILVTPFIHPSVPAKSGIVRLIAGANLKEETIGKAVSIIERLS